MYSRPVLLFLLVFLSANFYSCGKQAPQLPSNKGERPESKEVKTLLKLNLTLAQREDSVVKVYVLKHDDQLVKSELGFWYHIQSAANGQQLKDKDSCQFRWKVSLLNGKVVRDETQSAVMGHKDMIKGLEEGLKLMHKGETARFVIPWYLAYGRKGDAVAIPPYTSICCQVTLFK